LSFTTEPKSISFDIRNDHLTRGDVHTLLASDAPLDHQITLTGITLPA
jgi:hypothetical protein